MKLDMSVFLIFGNLFEKPKNKKYPHLTLNGAILYTGVSDLYRATFGALSQVKRGN
jgi:hypothetical protein